MATKSKTKVQGKGSMPVPITERLRNVPFVDEADDSPIGESTSLVYRFAEEVAKDVAPDMVEGEEKGFDIITIITLVISIFTTIMEKCPLAQKLRAKALRRPGPLQKSVLLKETVKLCQCMGLGRHAGKIYNSMLAKGSAIPEADADKLVEETLDDTSLLLI